MAYSGEPVGLPFPGRRTRIAVRVSKGLLFALLAFLTFTPGLPAYAAESDLASQSDRGQLGGVTKLPPGVGADPVPDLSLPKTVLSSVDKMITSWQLEQISSENLTLRNPSMGLRLLGGSVPHDELLGPDRAVVSSWSFWGVQALMGSLWVPLLSQSSNFTLLGTNSTGTYVTRRMYLATGIYSGELKITYKAISEGFLKWDLEFTAGAAGPYRLFYAWHNLTGSPAVSSSAKQFHVETGISNYTFSWSDIPQSFNTTSSTGTASFSLFVHLGSLTKGSSVLVDPSIVSSSTAATATAYTFQRKVFYDPKGGYYFVFYYDGAEFRYKSSRDGINWPTGGSLPSGLIQYSAGDETRLLHVLSKGQGVFVTAGSRESGSYYSSTMKTVSLKFANGTVSGPAITWSPVRTLVYVAEECDDGTYLTISCEMTHGIRLVGAGVDSQGNLAISYNWYVRRDSLYCGGGVFSASKLFVFYISQVYYVDGRSGCGNYDQDQIESVVLTSNSGGTIRVLYKIQIDSHYELRLSPIDSANPQTLTEEFAPEKDTWLDSSYQSTNYGSASSLILVGETTALAFVDFPLVGGIPSWSIRSALLKLNVGNPSCPVAYCETSISLHRQYWRESVLTYANAPKPFTSYDPKTFAYLYQAGAASVDVTGIVLDWYLPDENGNPESELKEGLMLKLNHTSESLYFSSKESTNAADRPKLAITYCCAAGPAQTVDGNAPDGYEFSAVTDSDYGLHITYRALSLRVNYVYQASLNSILVPSPDIFQVEASFPTITADYATGDVLVSAVHTSGPFFWAIMKNKASAEDWADAETVYAVSRGIARMVNLGSNYASSSNANSSWVSLVWTEGPIGGPFNVMYAGIPLPSVWSPFASPTSPWDGNGVTTFGQYFASLGEYVSPSTGALTIRQTDIVVPGRGLDLDITRVYVQPRDLSSSSPINYEAYPWAPLGNGWQLNFPWMNNEPKPRYIHLLNGQGYRIPSNFWTDSSNTFENHRGEHFRLVRYSNATLVLFTKSGIAYNFGTNHRLTTITDATGSNTIRFDYDSFNRISSICDTVGRTFLFSYSMGMLQSISQRAYGGTCNASGGQVRAVGYGYESGGLVSYTDPAGRVTTYGYDLTGWNLNRITYPTGWHTEYTYTATLRGTEAWSYRVSRQCVSSSTACGAMAPGFTVRQFEFNYTSGPGDQIIEAEVKSYNGTTLASYTNYAFSYSGMTRNVSDSSHQLVSGVHHRFGAKGETLTEIILVTDGLGGVGSYTNYYQYDLWGNLIYSRRAINPSAAWYHESFSAYYNNGLSPGFYAFQDTFSQDGLTQSDNSWNVYNGTWLVKNGAYGGTAQSYQEPGWMYFAWNDLGKADLSVQASVYVTSAIDSSDERVGIFVHYPGSGYHKWALVLRDRPNPSGHYLELLDEAVSWLSDGGPPYGQASARVSCAITTGVWYTFNMTVKGYTTTGWASAPGQPTCNVSGTFPASSPAAGGTGFGLYSGGYSAQFDDVTVATVAPAITTKPFTNSFIQDGAPGPTGLNNWLWTTKSPGSGWDSLVNWLPSTGWSVAPAVRDHGGSPWLTIPDWQDTQAQWIWWNTDAWSSSTDDQVWVRRVFNLKAPTTLTIEITADNTYTVYVDGIRLSGDGTWQTRETNSTSLGAGNHVLAVLADNAGPNNPAGLLLSARDSSGQVIFRTDRAAGPNIVTPAGNAQLQNGTGTVPTESYLGYYPWGGLREAKQRYDPPAGIGWLPSSMTYDAFGNLKNFTNPKNYATGFDYSSSYQFAYATNRTRADGPTKVTSRYDYDLNTGYIQSEVDPMGNTTSYEYDILGRLKRVNYPLQGYVQFTYNDQLNYVEITDTNGAKTRQHYDGIGRLVRTERFLTTSYSNQTYRYNWMDKTTRATDALGHTYLYQYDVLGRPVRVTKPDGNFTELFYDDVYPYVRTTNEKGHLRFDLYDRLGRHTSVLEQLIEGLFSFTQAGYVYDEVGNLRKVMTINALSAQYTNHTYDNLNRLIRTDYPDGKFETYEYDDNGNLKTKFDRKGLKTLYDYDPLDRVKTITYCGVPRTSESYTYDRNSRLVRLENQNTTLSYAYDARNRVLSEGVIVNSVTPRQVIDLGCSGTGGTSTATGGVNHSMVTWFAYDGELLESIESYRFPSSFDVRYSYDALGRVTTASRQNKDYASFTYNKNDQVETLTFGNGLVESYTHNTLGGLSRSTLKRSSTPLLVLNYQYDRVGTVASIVGQSTSTTGQILTINEQYRYDPLKRLTNATVTTGGWTNSLWYEYDLVGNRLRQNQNGYLTSYIHNVNSNQLTQSSSPNSTSTAFSHDSNGSLSSKNVTWSGMTNRWTNTWSNGTDRLQKTVRDGTVKGLYVYDGLGRMVESVNNGLPTFFTYLGTETLHSATGSTLTDYVYAGGMRIARVSGNSVHYYHTDHLGSTRLVTDSSNNPNIMFSNSYQPYGIDNGIAEGSEAYKFTGKPYSSSTGLYYNYQRWYDPEIGRFISADSILGSLSYPQTLNRYTYTVNNPVQYVDPTGEFPWLLAGLVVAMFFGGLGLGATLSPQIAEYTDPAMTLVGVVPVLGDFTADPYFAARDISSCALGQGCDQFQTGLDIAVLLPIVPGALARGKRVANLVDATTDLGRTTNRAEGLADAGRLIRTEKRLAKVGPANAIMFQMHSSGRLLSTGIYDEVGHLVKRIDFGHVHGPQKLWPQVHEFTWKMHEGIWRHTQLRARPFTYLDWPL